MGAAVTGGRGPAEDRKAETDRVCEGISEGVRPGRAREGRAGKMRERLSHLPIDVFAVFDGEYVQPFRAGSAVTNAIGPDPVGPDLVFLKVTFQRLAVERMHREVTEGFFDSFSCRAVTILKVFERLRCETDLPHCSSPKASLKE